MTEDMKINRDLHQYGNEKGLSVNMIHEILSGVDTNNKNNKPAPILTMIGYAQAFERQSYRLGIESFIKNGVRRSLIPILISFFENRRLLVKWQNVFSKAEEVLGGGAQGSTAGGILEFISQTAGNLNFLENDEVISSLMILAWLKYSIYF